ncbi:MAG: hypothetical protein WCR47_06390 [Desulfoplanes sp.]
MGLDLTTIDLPINLKLWHDAGIRSILSDPETVKTAWAQANKPAAPSPVKHRLQAVARPVVAPVPASPGPVRHPVPVAQQKSPSTPPRQTPKSPPGKLNNLPPKLREYFVNLNVPAFSLWTYWELPVDLSASPDPARQTLIKGILAALRWRKGSSVFWPISRLENNQLVPDLDTFTFGLQAITPVYIFCFGKQGSSLLLPDQKLTTFKRFTSPYTSKPVQILPGLDDMLPDNKITKTIAWKILQSYIPLPM